MKAQPLLVRVPVVIFAVLVGGIFVYARSGGRLFQEPARVTPAVAADANEPGGGPAIMMGTKSAPAFLPEQAPNVGTQQLAQPAPLTPVTPISPRAMLLPGSKSAVMIAPENPPPAVQAPASSSQTLLPGSKSRAVIDPQTFTQPPRNQVQQRASNRGVER